ncbi:MAG TPA: DinB family protein [Blastocatellia bacterium]|nr:DinB family protein [Blastocatellia bacterium]
MEFKLDHAINILSRTPNVLRSMLDGLPSEWISMNEGETTWSPYDVVGHLIHGERTDWIPRARIILQEGESRAFEPFDRFAQFDENRGKSPEELLRTFEVLRRENIDALRSMSLRPEDLSRKGKHPELGQVTLGELLATWVAHDQDHLVQIARTMAKQYREAVGPWQAYLSVMQK